jgi:hypothetical protein
MSSMKQSADRRWERDRSNLYEDGFYGNVPNETGSDHRDISWAGEQYCAAFTASQREYLYQVPRPKRRQRCQIVWQNPQEGSTPSHVAAAPRFSFLTWSK